MSSETTHTPTPDDLGTCEWCERRTAAVVIGEPADIDGWEHNVHHLIAADLIGFVCQDCWDAETR